MSQEFFQQIFLAELKKKEINNFTIKYFERNGFSKEDGFLTNAIANNIKLINLIDIVNPKNKRCSPFLVYLIQN
ncbi:MAG: hypothetical protein COA97_02160 [Flavobacteriales bacterium]|nr:MAG: hypothetical protein COA97_02160 [Flavobacteriales bacterium]